ncbi:MAG: dihydrofolate reductase family protein [Candidatus Nanopelagicaceae bacterium]|jgi:riboflavin biosynthesis pyrimidine reductase
MTPGAISSFSSVGIGPHIPPEGVSVVASLLIDPKGRVRDGQDSRKLSSPEDRRRFLALRRWADVILVGSKTFAAESYEKTRVPVIVYSRSKRKIHDWSLELSRIKASHGSKIFIEAGPGLLEELIEQRVIDRLYLTKTSRVSDDSASPIFHTEILEDSGLELISTDISPEDRHEIYQRALLEH